LNIKTIIRLTSPIIFSLLLLLGGCAPQSALRKPTGKVKLMLNLVQGGSYNLRMTAEQKVTQNLLGMLQATEQTLGIGYGFDIEEVEPSGIARVKVTYQGVSFKQDTDMLGTFEYDSADPPDDIPPAAAGYAAQVGQSFHIWIARNGAVSKVEGADEIVDRMLASIDLPEGLMKEALVSKMRDQFGNEGVLELMNNTFYIYPERAVAVRDTWNSQSVDIRSFAVALDNTYTLTDRSDGIATVEVRSTAKNLPGAKPPDMGMMQMKYELSGEQSGKIMLDEQTGWAVSAEINQKFEGELTMEGGMAMRGEEDLSIPITIETTIRLESLKK